MKKVFKQCMMAMLNYWTNTGIVKPLQIIVNMQGENLAILFHVMDKQLYKFRAVFDIDQRNFLMSRVLRKFLIV